MTTQGHAGVDVVVLAGGRSTRFGADKLAVVLDRVLAGLPAQAAVVCVGPQRPTCRAQVRWVREDPPLSGPLAAVAAGVAAGDRPIVVLAGGDMPRMGAALDALVAALEAAGGHHGVDAGPGDAGPVDGAVLLDRDGRVQLLASAWHRPALVAQLADIAAGVPAGHAPGAPKTAAGSGLGGVPLRLLARGTRLVEVEDLWDASRDVDTPADLA